MTAQYEQNGINTQPYTPLVVTTQDAVAILVTLGTITDGQSLAVNLFGGGSTPVSPANAGGVVANNYSITTADAIFTREAGVGVLAGSVVILNVTGTSAVVIFELDDSATETTCQLEITGLAVPYNHNLRYSAVQF